MSPSNRQDFMKAMVGRDKKIGKEIMLNFQKQNLKSNISFCIKQVHDC